MVNPENARRYEEQQLRLIVNQYVRQGFTIVTRDPAAVYSFDAEVYRESDDQRVFIELLNRRRTAEVNERKVAAIERVAELYPEARIDLRYLDEEAAPYVTLLTRDARPAHIEDLASILKKRLSTSKRNPLSNVSTFLELWATHALTLRAVSWAVDNSQARTESVLDLYNNLLRLGILEAPEQKDNEVSLDLFEIHEAVMAATQGAVVDTVYSEQLRKHIRFVRKRVRKIFKNLTSGNFNDL